jgi:hypothetical protein
VVSDELAGDMNVLGISDEIADAPREDEVEDEGYEVWSDNLLTLRVFLRLESKWNVVAAPDGEMVRTGIWWPNVEGALRTTNGVPRRAWPEMVADLEAMESAALQVMNKARQARREERQRKLDAMNQQR